MISGEQKRDLSVPALMRAHGLYPRKRLGQSFLTDPHALNRIVAAADLTSDDTVLEIGAGLGTLTQALAERAGRVVAIELDDGLVRILHEQLADLPNVEIIHGDVLRIPRQGFQNLGYKLVANLPYYITSAVLRHFLEREPRPRIMVVTVQREVAERIVAKPGGMSLLAVSVQFYGAPRIVTRIPPGAFYPPPKIDSAVVRIDVAEQPTVVLGAGEGETGDARAFFRVVRAGFSQKRKTLRNALSAGLRLPPAEVEAALNAAGIDPRRRAQTLGLQEWADLTAALSQLN
jgi:16S rRNA (adenine1518-N6/adenine1519-N6)-dimethyltransferase